MSDFTRRRILQSTLPLLSASLAASCTEAATPSAPAAPVATVPRGVPRLGVNFDSITDWGTELPFVDMFRSSREWISQRQGAGWGQGPALSLDEAGWIRSLEPGCFAETPMCTIEGGGHFPSGTYRVFFDGKGELEFWNAGRLVDSGPGQATVDVQASRGGPIWLRLRETDPSDPLRNIRVLRPGYDEKTPLNDFDPAFVERWRGLDCVRFMGWQRTNDSRQSRWKDRAKPTDARFGAAGVAVEVMVDLANRLDAAPWFCMPHRADDEFVTEFAKIVRQRLAPHLKVYIEHSNELWNFIFQQTREVRDEAQAARISQAAAIARRSVKMFRLWQEVFGSRERLVRVLPSQAANPDLSDQILRHEDAYKHADVLAIAPYIPGDVQPGGSGMTAAQVERWSVDALHDYLAEKAFPVAVAAMKQQKAVADKYGLKLVAYEGGQHLVGILGVENNDAVTRLLHAANAHPRMGKLYERYFEAWERAGGDLHCHFSSVSKWSKWGSWGLMQYADEDPKQSPKFMAAMRWARKVGHKVKLPA